jgi:outer membrane lipoprotein-sorting protein
MARSEIDAMEELNQSWDALVRDGLAAENSDGVAAIVRRLAALDDTPDPDPAFVQQLGARLTGGAGTARLMPVDSLEARATRRHWFISPAMVRWPLTGVAAAVLVVAVVSVALWSARPDPVSAQEVLLRAQATAENLAGSGVRSFELTQVLVADGTLPSGAHGQTRSETHVWHEAPNRWRFEMLFTALPDQSADPAPRVTVADGQKIWSYDPRRRELQISPGTLLGGKGKGGIAPFGGGDLNTLLQQARTCGSPRMVGEEPIAGRPAYKISLGPSTCPSAADALMNGPETIWVDKETYVVLKRMVQDPTNQRVVYTNEVTSIRYNLALADTTFQFSPPPGTTVHDNRLQPAPAPVVSGK